MQQVISVAARGTVAKRLYAGTAGPGAVYGYVSGTTWALLGTLGFSVNSLVRYKGKLYAAVNVTDAANWNGSAAVFRYDADTDWTQVGGWGAGTGALTLAVYG